MTRFRARLRLARMRRRPIALGITQPVPEVEVGPSREEEINARIRELLARPSGPGGMAPADVAPGDVWQRIYGGRP